ncbi:hypothetical protein CSAL01_06443 [Colletotrichum salicis]|uniref:Uncharacterized protein n=1 Tax=Colletotrichum salicis TaxID=1209931 RepID=A0A135U0E0_9PEZI|nr:hypothetical protein CSAL01_06443 [Colletotrichum salicis]
MRSSPACGWRQAPSAESRVSGFSRPGTPGIKLWLAIRKIKRERRGGDQKHGSKWTWVVELPILQKAVPVSILAWKELTLHSRRL